MATDSAPPLAGLLLAATIAALATFVHTLPFPPFTMGSRHPVDAILIAISIGIVVRNLVPLPGLLRPGIKYAVKSVLPFAIVLMGAKLDFFDVLRVSGQALATNLICVTVALGFTLWACQKAKVSRRLGLLIGVGTAICGGTAIAVTAPIVEAEDNETAFAITTITLFGLISIPVFPLIGTAIGLDQTEFGVWAGTAIHATPQVMAAAFSYGAEAGETAVIVKLVRVLLLAPVVVVIGAIYARDKRRHQQAHVPARTRFTTLFPPFILGFVALALAKTLNLLPDFTLHLAHSFLWEAGSLDVSMSDMVTTASSWLVTVAMAGVGLGVHLRGLAKVGLSALYVGLGAAVVLAAFSLGMLKLLL
ncbi:MAG: putative sulfate exporter family transporter [Nannocystaceae bacterium]|nr:putative sulfate exporter family transporter [Nannocystaceae bacterium]